MRRRAAHQYYPKYSGSFRLYARKRLRDDVAAIRTKLGIRDGDTAMCFVGRLGKEKHRRAGGVFCRAFRGDDAYKLFIIGDGPEKENLERQIVRLGVGAQVRLLGRIEHQFLPPYYHACDLFTTASLSEMNSISMLEAMASGLYVIQRLDIYNKNQITPGENGNVFNTAEETVALLREEAALTPEQRTAPPKGNSVYAALRRKKSSSVRSSTYMSAQWPNIRPR